MRRTSCEIDSISERKIPGSFKGGACAARSSPESPARVPPLNDVVFAGLKFLHRKLRIVRELVADDLARAIVKRECILKLLGKSAAADGRDIEQQTILRIIELQT